jgi:uncharacterized protein (DUF736 family)
VIIGKFAQNGDGYTGSIITAGLSIPDVMFSPVPVKIGDGPDFVILADGMGEQFELGAAWAKTSKKGKPYLSVKLDSPMFVAPINCALIPQIDSSHALVWNRDAYKDEDHTGASISPSASRPFHEIAQTIE